MVKVLRNPAGEALARASENLLNLAVQKRRLDIQEAKEDRLAAAQRHDQNIKRFGAELTFLPEGTTFNEAPDSFKETATATFGEGFLEDFGDIPVNKRTVEGVLRNLAIGAADRLGPQGANAVGQAYLLSQMGRQEASFTGLEGTRDIEALQAAGAETTTEFIKENPDQGFLQLLNSTIKNLGGTGFVTGPEGNLVDQDQADYLTQLARTRISLRNAATAERNAAISGGRLALAQDKFDFYKENLPQEQQQALVRNVQTVSNQNGLPVPPPGIAEEMAALSATGASRDEWVEFAARNPAFSANARLFQGQTQAVELGEDALLAQTPRGQELLAFEERVNNANLDAETRTKLFREVTNARNDILSDAFSIEGGISFEPGIMGKALNTVTPFGDPFGGDDPQISQPDIPRGLQVTAALFATGGIDDDTFDQLTAGLDPQVVAGALEQVGEAREEEE